MKNLSFSVFNVVSVVAVILLVVLIVMPFNLINMEQAQRIAKWKSEFEQLEYCFSLVKLHEGTIVPTEQESGKLLTDEYMLERIKPYFNFSGDTFEEVKKYSYRKMNGGSMDKESQFYFDRFFKYKNGMVFSIKKSNRAKFSEKHPLYFMYLDINGVEKPNRIGQDVFLVSIYKNHILALGHSKEYAKLKSNCSPIGNGLYCSEYYLLGGRF